MTDREGLIALRRILAAALNALDEHLAKPAGPTREDKERAGAEHWAKTDTSKPVT